MSIKKYYITWKKFDYDKLIVQTVGRYDTYQEMYEAWREWVRTGLGGWYEMGISE